MGREGSRGLQEPLGKHKPLGKVLTLQVRWHLTKKKAFHLEETAQRSREGSVRCVLETAMRLASWVNRGHGGWKGGLGPPHWGPENTARIWTLLEAVGMLKCSHRELATQKCFLSGIYMFLALWPPTPSPTHSTRQCGTSAQSAVFTHSASTTELVLCLTFGYYRNWIPWWSVSCLDRKAMHGKV